MRSALSISRNTNLVFPHDVGPVIMAVHGWTNGNMSTPRYDFRLSLSTRLRRPIYSTFTPSLPLSLPPSLPTLRREREGRRGGARAHNIHLAVVDSCTRASACTRRSTDSAQSFERRAAQCQDESCDHHRNHPRRLCDGAEDDSRIVVHLSTISDVWKVAEV